MKKILSLILLALLPLVASADAVEIDGIYYNLVSKIKEAEVTSNPNGYSGAVNIPASVTYEGVTYSVTSIGYRAFYLCKSLQAITLPEGLTTIEQSAFYYCDVLTSITIPNSVTSIGEGAFSWCLGLTSITIPNSVTSIGGNAFYECVGLTSVTIPNSVTSIGKATFSGCSGLTSVNIGNSVTSIGDYAFSWCSGLTSVTIPNSVTSIGGSAFYNCIGLTSVTIPNSVTSIGSIAFGGCSGLTSINIPNSVTSIGGAAFSGCSGLTSVTIPESMTSINMGVFEDCSSLTSIDIPNSVTSIGDSAFGGCSGLTSVTIPNSVTTIESGAFYNCSGLTSATIGNSVTSIGSSAFANCPELADVYCLAEKVPETGSDAYFFTPIASATLHVPEGSIEAYRTTKPWSNFGNIVALAGIIGDLNHDGKVDIADAVTVLNIMAAGEYDGEADVNGDQKVDIADFVTILNIMAGQSITYNLTCPDDHHPHAIDLGLPSGTKWCCCNVGATTPEDYGGYYAWGETSEKIIYETSTYQYAVVDDNSGYLYDDETGHHYRCINIGSDIAGTDYDAATVNMGALWRMPSFEQMKELDNNCSSQWTTRNGVNGILATGRNGGQVFLPASGERLGDGLGSAGDIGSYWSSSYSPYEADGAYGLNFYSDNNSCFFYPLFLVIGRSVRAVWKP